MIVFNKEQNDYSIWMNIHKFKEEGEDFEERNRENFWISLWS